MSKYKTYDARVAVTADLSTASIDMLSNTISPIRDNVHIDLDVADSITITYKYRTYTLDKDRLFMFLTTMFMKED